MDPMRARMFTWIAAWMLACCAAGAPAQTKTFEARDTLKTDDAIADLAWTPRPFTVTCAPASDGCDAVVSFPSPIESEIPAVTMWWYAARDGAGEPIEAPALLLVHSLHPQMPVTRLLAANLSRRGLHCFLVHLPGYAGRGDGSGRFAGVVALLHGKQGVADVRRARDAIAALPNIAPGPVAIEGTSLGGFVAAAAAGMDGAFDPVFLLLSGGDGARVLREGRADAAILRQRMDEAGYDDDALAAILRPVEPMRLVQRLNPARTYLYSARADQVVPRACTDCLSEALGLDAAHHLWFDGDHYSATLFLPAIAEHIAAVMAEL